MRTPCIPKYHALQAWYRLAQQEHSGPTFLLRLHRVSVWRSVPFGYSGEFQASHDDARLLLVACDLGWSRCHRSDGAHFLLARLAGVNQSIEYVDAQRDWLCA